MKIHFRSKKFILFTSLFFLLGGIVSSILFLLKSSVIAETGEIALKGVHNKAIVRRDHLGIPFIEASTEADLFFVVGYIQAADRRWQMEVLKRLSQGRLSELLSKDFIDFDHYMRIIGIRRQAEKIFNGLPEYLKKILQSYSNGVNHYTKENILPPEFHIIAHTPEKWTPLDSITIYGFVNFTLSVNHIEEIAFLKLASKFGHEKAAYLFPSYHDEPLPIEEARKTANVMLREPNEIHKLILEIQKVYPVGFPASNNWAISPQKSESGKSLLANDTHLVLGIPSPWMIMNLKSNDYRSAGVLIPGTPFVVLGYNGKIAWGATMVMTDSQDIFLEKLKKINGELHYLYRNKWLPTKKIKDTIRVRGDKDVNIMIHITHNGPILNDSLKREPLIPIRPNSYQSDYGLSFRWSFHDEDHSIQGLYKLAKADTMEKTKSALSLLNSTYLNIVYSDGKNIAWKATGKIPIRKNGSGKLPSPGWLIDHQWIGYHPFESNPEKFNPVEGYIATANQRPVPSDHKLYISSSWFSPHRYERINEILKKESKINLNYMVKMQSDLYSKFAAKAQKQLFLKKESEIRKAISRLNDKNIQKDAILAFKIIKKFNAKMESNSKGAAVFESFMHSFTKNVFLDEFSTEESEHWLAFLNSNARSYDAVEDHLLVERNSPFYDNIHTNIIEDRIDIISVSLADAIQLCRDEMGNDPSKWEWGKLHTYHWEHIFSKQFPIMSPYLDIGPLPASGNAHTLNVSRYMLGKDFNTTVLPAMRFLVDFSRKEPAFLVSYGGHSGNPSSEHYADMTDFFMQGKVHPMPFHNTPDILRHYYKKLTIWNDSIHR